MRQDGKVSPIGVRIVGSRSKSLSPILVLMGESWSDANVSRNTSRLALVTWVPDPTNIWGTLPHNDSSAVPVVLSFMSWWSTWCWVIVNGSQLSLSHFQHVGCILTCNQQSTLLSNSGNRSLYCNQKKALSWNYKTEMLKTCHAKMNHAEHGTPLCIGLSTKEWEVLVGVWCCQHQQYGPCCTWNEKHKKDNRDHDSGRKSSPIKIIIMIMTTGWCRSHHDFPFARLCDAVTHAAFRRKLYPQLVPSKIYWENPWKMDG